MESSSITADENGEHAHFSRIYTANNTLYKAETDGVRLKNVNGSSDWIYAGDTTAGCPGGDICGVTDTSGAGKPHNNMEPYKVVYIFMRSA